MSQRSERVLEGLKKAYTTYFDIEEIDDGTALKARCDYHMRDSQYVLVKKAELWAAENHEYLYLWDAGRLDTAGVEEIFRRKKLKKRREFKLSLHGWMEFRIAAVDLSTGEITVNRAGRAFGKDLRQLTDRIISAN